ncbi:acetyl-CoA acetyltransferase [Methylophaga sp. 42_25_T18]|nr:acetyl-CoA acetyltransferase [Methylophaga sp. 42_25_T18]
MNKNVARPAYTNRKVYIVDGSRTPFIKARGKPGPFSSSDLAVAAARPLLNRHSFSPSDLDEVILGCVMPSPDETNIARIVSLRLGCGHDVPAWTVQRNCASGMQALDSAASNISTGRSDLVLAGGCEAMSRAPLLLKPEMVTWLAAWQKSRTFKAKLSALSKLRPALFAPVIGLLRGLRDPTVGLSMGQTAEILAHRFGIDRTQMDEFALASHQKLAAAVENDVLTEIEAIIASDGSVFDDDSGLRADSSLDKLAKLRPVFDRQGLVSAGNSAQVTDGAACLLLASEDAVKEYNLPVLGQIIDCHWAGLEPSQMGLGPAHAVPPLLHRHNLKLKDIDYWEINEAFAVQVQACLAAWQGEDYCLNELALDTTLGAIDTSRLNVDGGAIALGHPVGATGARIVLHLLNVLQRNKAKTGIASLCIGGGQGGAMLISTEGITL